MYFTDAFNNMPEADRESFYKTIFLHDPSEYAAKIRQEYYAGVLKYMGKNVKIGVGVKIKNPQWISIDDNVTIDDDATLIARGEGGIVIGSGSVVVKTIPPYSVAVGNPARVIRKRG